LLLSRVYPIARPRKLPEELKQHDFLTLAQTEAHARTRIRWLGMAHLNEGRTYREVATYLCVKPETVKGYDEIVEICCQAWNSFVKMSDLIQSLCHRDWATLE